MKTNPATMLRVTMLHASFFIAAIFALASGRLFAEINTHTIEGYADKLSVGPGETIRFSVHIPSGRHRYTVEFLRYGTDTDGEDAIGTRVAGPYTGNNGQVRNFDNQSCVQGARWPVSFSLKLPTADTVGDAPFSDVPLRAAAWKSGFYTAKLTDIATGDYFHITFIVRDGDALRKRIALIASTNTWTAYNFWPGAVVDGELAGCSIYEGQSGAIYQPCYTPALNEVSFLRPNPYSTLETHDTLDLCPVLPYYRTEHLVAGELRVAEWLEANNKNYSMLTDGDIDSTPGVLDPTVFRTVIISTHSEYWTSRMYDAVKDYLAAGGNVICLSGNTCYWQTTLTNEGGNQTLTKGPLWDTQQQADLLGLASFDASGVANSYAAPYRVLSASHWAFANTGGAATIGNDGVVLGNTVCPAGQHGASGWEVDRTDPSLHFFAKEFVVLGKANQATRYQSGEMIYMRKASAGQVFNAGSILFGQSLLVDEALSKTMLKVLDRFNRRSFSDFNGDGKPDLLARKADGTLWSYRCDGAGNISPGTRIATGITETNRLLAPGDMNSDGKADLITRQINGDLWLHKGTGAGALQPRVRIGTGWNVFNAIIAPGDFDDDGFPDLLGRKPDGTLWFYRGTSSGTLETPASFFNIGWQVFNAIIAPGDLNEDGNPDILARKPDGTLWRYYGDGHGGFSGIGVQVGTGFGRFVEMMTPGDFNGDHHADILGRKADGSLLLFRGAGDGSFSNPQGVAINQGWNIFSQVAGVW